MPDTTHRTREPVTAADLMRPAAEAFRVFTEGPADKAGLDAMAEALEDLEDEIAGLMAARDKASAEARGEWLTMTMADWQRFHESPSPLRSIREHRGLTQTDLSQRSGVARPEISAMEAGTRRGTVDTFHKLARALNVPIDILVRD